MDHRRGRPFSSRPALPVFISCRTSPSAITFVASATMRSTAHPVDRDHQLERARIQEVADQHGGRVAERRVGRRAAAPLRGLVDDVVVQQRRRVDHLDDRGERVLVAAGVAACAGGQQQQRRPQPLAAAADDVVGDLADERDLGGERALERRVDLGHAGTDDGRQEIDGHADGRRLAPARRRSARAAGRRGRGRGGTTRNGTGSAGTPCRRARAPSGTALPRFDSAGRNAL